MADAPPQPRGLIDTSVAIGIEQVDGAQLPEEIAISALTLAELAAGPHATADTAERARRQDRLQRFEAELEALAFDSACARAYGSVYAAVVAAGRKTRGPRAVDLMIVATAIAHQLPLYTRNPDHLRGLDGLVTVMPVAD